MEKINIPDEYLPLTHFSTGEKKIKKKKKLKGSFLTTFESSLDTEKTETSLGLETEVTGTLPELLDKVHEAGEKLKEKPTLDTIKEYKIVVRSFIRRVVEQSLTIEEKKSGVNILKRKRFTLIKVIDSKLEKLAAGVLRTQQDQLEILHRVDEINGLLVDLLQ